MACVGLISLIRTLELQFLEPRPILVADYKDEIQCLHQRLSVLVALLEESEKELNVSQAQKDVIARAKDISFRAEDEIESEPIFRVSYNFHKSRTFLFFFGDSGYFVRNDYVSWRQDVSFKMIRVLDLRTIYFGGAPTFDITDLILLREEIDCDEEISSKWLQDLWKSQNLRSTSSPLKKLKKLKQIEQSRNLKVEEARL
nr:putative late blight resistance protein homolog R1A-3 isoform X2 [Ipomoea batatas]GME20919.1 putative late blight resistance protein homolog R1A-3 isoform X2 [Ipomoea batatas]